MKSAIVKRSVVLNGHKTSVSLEQQFWDIVRLLAAREQVTVSALLRRVDEARTHSNLSSAVRVFVLEQVRAQAGSVFERRTPASMPYAPSLGVA